MRIWDKVPPNKLCSKHLLAEHRETLCIWSVIANNKKGYSKHPEVKRWVGHLPALLSRHKCIQEEAINRGYNFKDLPPAWIGGSATIPEAWDDQLERLKLKGCDCKI